MSKHPMHGRRHRGQRIAERPPWTPELAARIDDLVPGAYHGPVRLGGDRCATWPPMWSLRLPHTNRETYYGFAHYADQDAWLADYLNERGAPVPEGL